MKIINNQNIITNKQLTYFISLFDKEYYPRILIIHENKTQYIVELLKYNISLLGMLPFIMMGRIEGVCNSRTKVINIFTFAENDDGEDIQSKQLYSLHALTHELRHIYQKSKNISETEDETDEFTTNFINKNSSIISDIMGWEDEWSVEEE